MLGPGRYRIPVGILIIVLPLQGCGGGADGVKPDPVYQIVQAPQASGDQQSWTTGHTLPNPIRVLVTRDGLPAEGIRVLWSADSGQGLLSPGVSVTGPDGTAISRWTMSIRSGPHHAWARLEDTPDDSVGFSATARPNFPVTLHLVSGDGQSGPVNTTLSKPLAVRVGDEFDNPFPGAPVEWVVVSGAASVESLTTCGADGVAVTEVTLGAQPGPLVIEAHFPDSGGQPQVTFTLNVTP